MAKKSNDFEKFWQELKRRKVFKVVAMYAGTAFIILQLVDIIAQPLQLPVWTMTLVIVLLSIGFIITFLFTWVYDITPVGIKKTDSIEGAKKEASQVVPVKRRIKVSDIIIAAMTIAIVILLYPKIFNKDKFKNIKDPDGRISIAVMPFQNMTNDTIWNIWQHGIQNELIISLTNSELLKVRQVESINSLIQDKGLTNIASLTPTIASDISQKLDANIFIYGSIKQAGNTIRLNAQLIDSKTNESIKSFELEGPSKENMIFQIIDSLKQKITDFLVLFKLINESSEGIQIGLRMFGSTNSPEAYRYFIYSGNAYSKNDFITSMNMASKALEIDSNFINAGFSLMSAYEAQDMYKEAKKVCRRLYEKKDQMPLKTQLFIKQTYAIYFETPHEEITYLNQLKSIDDQDPASYLNLGGVYSQLLQFDNAISEYKKAKEIFEKRVSLPPVYLYLKLGEAYQSKKDYNKAKKFYSKAGQRFSNDYPKANRDVFHEWLLYDQAILSLIEGRIKEATKYIGEYISERKAFSASEAVIATELAEIYSKAYILDKAEEFYRQALSLEPEAIGRMNTLAYFLIDKTHNVDEGLSLVDSTLILSPDNYNYLHTKGWGLFKQGKYQEALEILQQSWNLRVQNSMYDHEAYLHLEEAKKAVAGQK